MTSTADGHPMPPGRTPPVLALHVAGWAIVSAFVPLVLAFESRQRKKGPRSRTR